MSDDLLEAIRDVAALLDERWEERHAAESRVLPIATEPPSAPRRTGLRIALAAAVCVLIAFAVFGVLAADQESRPATTPDDDTVALVPASSDEWHTARTFIHRAPRLPEGHVVFVAPTSGRDRLGRSAMISIVSLPFQGRLSDLHGEERSGSGLVGRVEQFNVQDHRVVLHVDVQSDAGATKRVVVNGGPDFDIDTLFELAATVDADVPGHQYQPPEGWEIIRSSPRRNPPTRSFQGWAGENYESPYIMVTTLTSASESDVWLLAPPFLGGEMQIRGRTARVVPTDGSGLRITWAESDHMVVHVEFYDDGEWRGLLDRARAEIEALVAVDEQGWLEIPRTE